MRIRTAERLHLQDVEDEVEASVISHNLSVTGASRAVVDDVREACASRSRPINLAEAKALMKELRLRGTLHLMPATRREVAGIDRPRLLEIAGIVAAAYTIGTIEVRP